MDKVWTEYSVVEETRRQYRSNGHYKWRFIQVRPRLKGRRLMNMVVTTRLMKGMSQTELAERVGVTRQTINNIEINKTMPAVDVALAIAEVLEVEIADLFIFVS